MPELAEWESFYVIVGGGAAALIGLQFVVLTLIAEKPQLASPEAGAAFATPTIVHFSSALALAAGLRIPWNGAGPIAVLLAIGGFAGMAYTGVVTRRMRKQTAYRPELEDWIFHAALPSAAYALLALAAFAVPRHLEEALLGVGAATLALLFIGIHNTWDAVSYHVFVTMRKARDREPPSE
jgi:hypothetical protein